MARSEACEVFIEQEIKAGLEENKQPYEIGKELSAWLQEKMNVYVRPNTITVRAMRIRSGDVTNVISPQEQLLRLLIRAHRLCKKIEMDEKDKYHALSMLTNISKIIHETIKEEKPR